jgi:ABC-type molybdate transport system substrate-binding protein
MRERIEKGEHVDVFTSADVGHARKLVDEGRASVMAVHAQYRVPSVADGFRCDAG